MSSLPAYRLTVEMTGEAVFIPQSQKGKVILVRRVHDLRSSGLSVRPVSKADSDHDNDKNRDRHRIAKNGSCDLPRP